MESGFQFGVGQWETNDGNKAVVLHRLNADSSYYLLIGYVEFRNGQQTRGVWRLDGAWIDESYHRYSLKQPKREPREWWLNRYQHTTRAYTTRKEADRPTTNDRIECIHVREVMEED